MRLGVVRNPRDPNDASRTGEMQATLATMLGRDDVTIVRADSHPALLQRFTHEDIDAAWLTPAMVVEVSRRAKLGLILASLRGGAAEYRSALLVRRDGPIEQLEQLRGVRAGWVDPWSAAGYLFPRRFLRSQGLDPMGLFGEQRFYGTYQAVTEALRDHEVDVAALYDPEVPARRGPSHNELTGLDAFRVLARSAPIPSDALCFSDALDSELLQTVKTRLCSPVLGAFAGLLDADGFTPRAIEAYRPVRDALEDEWGRTSSDPPPSAT